MGYKLAGFKSLGGCDIDPQMAAIYRKNHHPKFFFEEGIKQFLARPDEELPKELFSLDVLDGSPPCSTFSMSGSREDSWGKEKRFREGQAVQVLDDLFFDFIAVADRLRPKVVIAENVKGMLLGNAKGYVVEVTRKMFDAGYDMQLFVVDSSRTGVAQRRERLFFIGRRRDLGLPKISLSFDGKPIPAEDAIAGVGGDRDPINETYARLWRKTMPGKSLSSAHKKGSFFNSVRLHPRKPSPCLCADKQAKFIHWSEPATLSGKEIARLQSFPDDYEFGDAQPKYVCGMSVPPYMMQRIADTIAGQWFAK